ncbi:MAG TPA: glycerol-3-phosphate 1-O-acyltransferase PlsY [Rhodocyclaceae bacterium]|nr:glycerol-3-phosphate 1-O-acyltransferase PlsY [Rhodocyclaceae bacterium]
MELAVAIILGYLLGSLPFAVIVSRAFGLADPRRVGSGNPGATNVLRSGHKLAALLTLLGDAAKGWFAMFVAFKVGAGETAVAAAGIAAFLGHVFPFTLGFKGGKGVATGLGVLLFFSGALGGIVAGIWLLVVLFTRYSSLGALTAATGAPIVAWYLLEQPKVLIPVTLLSMVLIVRHRSNIRNLLAGVETRIGAPKKKKPQAG